jgi:CRISPR-associated endonuclease/helicase Cas3
MSFYSHATINEDQQKEGSKKLKTHLYQVLEIALQNLYPRIDLNFNQEQISRLIEDICKLHDLGKYTSFFQNYLLEREKVSSDMKKHSRIGAYCLANKYVEEQFKMAFWGYFCIVNHHGNLKNVRETEFFGETGKQTYKKRFELQKNDLDSKIQQIEKELNLSGLNHWLYFPDYSLFRKNLRKLLKKEPDIKDYYIINYIFSLLTEADKLDASETPIYNKQPIDASAVENYIPLPASEQLPAIENTTKQNDLRNLARYTVTQNLKDPEILNYRLFTLTAPTGIGKTLTSLDFALKLKAQIRQHQNYEAQIIYGLPFINIIEQAYEVYSNEVFRKDIKNAKIRVLAHYQYTDIFGNENDEEQSRYQQKLMQLDTWQSDVVITSFVQFFETLITNRNKLLKKFHHYAGSIIILDEVQTLKLDLMPLIGAALYYLAKFLNARIILMTATQPKIFDLAQQFILDKEEEKAETKELLPNNSQFFSKFERTKVVPLIEEATGNTDFSEIFQNYWNKDKSCLIVCNTVQRSLDIYENISNLEMSNPVYYLSTNIIPAQRESIIESIKKDLSERECPVLITTQVVEAGVDLDFDMGFRDIGPVDSIVQVAGRINRENSENRKNSPLYIVRFEDQKGTADAAKVYGDLTLFQAKQALENQHEFLEKDYKKLVEHYFSELSNKKAFDISLNIFQSMKSLRYDGDKEEYPVSGFKIIDQAPWAESVFIETDEKAIEARKAFESLLNQGISKERFERDYKLTFHQHIIAVPEYLEKMKELKADGNCYLTENILLIRNELLEDYYSNITGFKRQKPQETNTLEML